MDRAAWWAAVHGVEKSQTQTSMSTTHKHQGYTHVFKATLWPQPTPPSPWRCCHTPPFLPPTPSCSHPDSTEEREVVEEA